MNKASKSIRKIKCLIVAVCLVVAVLSVLCGCDRIPQPPYEPNTVFPEEFSGLIKGKTVYVTSIGQSPDIEVLCHAMKGVGVTHVKNSLLTASDVESGSVVFLVVGCSMKAMAEFDVTRTSELNRVIQFSERAEKDEITVVAWHLGGVARRGSVSDSMIQSAFENAHLALFTADGNFEDAYGNRNLSDWAIAASVPYCQLSGNLPQVLKELSGDDLND